MNAGGIMKQQDSQATWGGRFSEGPAERMIRFSESVSFDARLAPFDIACSKAHSAMLAHVGILTAAERDAIHAGLDQILGEVERGEFRWDVRLEDVHMNIEQALTERVPAAAKLHTARSRNDQVATDMRLFFRHACDELGGALDSLLRVMVALAERGRDIHIPGYTHLQRAQPVPIAHHVLAWVEMFGRDRERLAQLRERANVCPLGSGAIAGTTLPIDRAFAAVQLGFVDADGAPRLTANSMDAVADRDTFIEFAGACALIGLHLSRVAEDVILWSSAEFAFASLPDAYTTGSSLMPQKKNPDALELIRGKSGRLTGALMALHTMVKGLPLTYNRDLQEDKPPVFDAFETTRDCLAVLEGALAGMRLREDRCAAAVADPALLATDLVDYLVRKGRAFRDAHHVIGRLVALAERKGVGLHELSDADLRGQDSLFDSDWRDVFSVERAMRMRTEPGMPSPEQVSLQIERWKNILS